MYLLSFSANSPIDLSSSSSVISNESLESKLMNFLSFSSSSLMFPEMEYNSSLSLVSSGADFRRVLASKYFLLCSSRSLNSEFLTSIILSNDSKSSFLPWSSLIFKLRLSNLLLSLAISSTRCLFWYMLVLIKSRSFNFDSLIDFSLFNLSSFWVFSLIFLLLLDIVVSYVWISSFFLSSLISDWQTGHLFSTFLMSDNGSSKDLISWFKLMESFLKASISSLMLSISFLILVLRPSTRPSKWFKSSLVLIGAISSSKSKLDKTSIDLLENLSKSWPYWPISFSKLSFSFSNSFIRLTSELNSAFFPINALISASILMNFSWFSFSWAIVFLYPSICFRSSLFFSSSTLSLLNFKKESLKSL